MSLKVLNSAELGFLTLKIIQQKVHAFIWQSRKILFNKSWQNKQKPGHNENKQHLRSGVRATKTGTFLPFARPPFYRI